MSNVSHFRGRVSLDRGHTAARRWQMEVRNIDADLLVSRDDGYRSMAEANEACDRDIAAAELAWVRGWSKKMLRRGPR
jgi:hypothetical protein